MLHVTPNDHLREEWLGFSGNVDTDQSRQKETVWKLKPC